MEDEQEVQLESFRSFAAGLALAATLAGGSAYAGDIIGHPEEAAIELIAQGPWKPTVPLKLVSSRPAKVSPEAIAWVEWDEGSGRAISMNVATYTDVYKRASKPGTGQLEAIRNIAAAIAHEQAHVVLGPNEEQAYEAQLTTLSQLGASSAEIGLIRRSKDKAVKAQKDFYAKAREAAKK